MTINKPPLVKTKNVSCGVASISYAGEKLPGYVEPVYDDPNDARSETNSEESSTTKGEDDQASEEYLLQQRYNLQQKRTCRPDRRYHTADSIEHLRQEKDNSIHKRLSWNYGQQQLSPHQHSSTCPYHVNDANNTSGHRLLHPRPLDCSQSATNKCLSNDSVYSSSGFSSTSSVPLSVGSVETNHELICTCCAAAARALSTGGDSKLDEEDEDGDANDKSIVTLTDRDSALSASPALSQPASGFYHAYSNSQCSTESGTSIPDHELGYLNQCASGASSTAHVQPSASDITINVSEIKDGISSVHITLAGAPNTVTRPSKADLKKMKDFLLSNCNVESS